MSAPIHESLPKLYRKLLPEFFAATIAIETKATCSSCPMTKGREHALAKLPISGFHPTTKCCSYQPGHVNYLVGSLLADRDPALAEGQQRMRHRIEQRLGQPFGVSSPADLKAAYESEHTANQRKNPQLVCGFFDHGGGKCTIWQHRDAVCSTFFCKHVRGADGRAFWMSLKEYLEAVEDQLSRYATYTVAPELFHYAENRLQDETPLSPEEYTKIWGAYAGREAEFYIQCYERVVALKPADVEKMLGFDGVLEFDQVRKCYANLEEAPLPPRLMLARNLETFRISPEMVGVTGHQKSDAVPMAPDLFAALSEFSIFKDVELCRAEMLKRHGLRISDDLLRELVQHRILQAHQS